MFSLQPSAFHCPKQGFKKYYGLKKEGVNKQINQCTEVACIIFEKGTQLTVEQHGVGESTYNLTLQKHNY